MALTTLPLEILNRIFGYLELQDLFRACSTCRRFRDAFRPDCLVTIVENGDVDQAIAEASYLLRCHALLQHFLTYGEDAPHLKATLAAIPVGPILQEFFIDLGPWHADTQFLLDHGAVLDDVPQGISSLLAYTLFDQELNDDEAEKRVAYLIENGADLHGMFSSYEDFVDDLATEKLLQRVQITLNHGGPLPSAPPALKSELARSYAANGFTEVEPLIANVPDALTILLADQVEHYGIGPRLDDLLQRGASFDNLPTMPDELPGYHAAAMKAVIRGGDALKTPDDNGNCPLYYLAGSGYVGLTRDAIRKGAPINAQNKDGWTALYAAASQGHHKVVQELLDANADTSILNERGGSPLLTASLHDHFDTVRVLVDGGADLNLADKTGMTPLFHAIYKGNLTSIQLLLDAGVDQTVTFESWTPLFAAAYFGQHAALHILAQHSDPCAPISIEETPIHAAASQGHLRCVQLLHSLGVPLSIRGESDNTIAHRAAQYGHVDILQWLEGKVDLNVKTDATPLHLAAKNGHLDTVKWLLERVPYDKDGKTPLDLACDGGHLPVVELLIEKGAEVNTNSENGPLYFAAGKGHVDVMQFLLQKGAHPDGNDIAPLLAAIHSDHPDAVRVLLAASADVEAKTENNIPALQFAAFFGHVEVARRLLDAGADIAKVSEIGCDALQCAAIGQHEELARLLLQRGATVTDSDAIPPEAQQWLEELVTRTSPH